MVSCGQSPLHAKRLWLVARMAPDLIRGEIRDEMPTRFRAWRSSGLRALIECHFPIGDVVSLTRPGHGCPLCVRALLHGLARMIPDLDPREIRDEMPTRISRFALIRATDSHRCPFSHSSEPACRSATHETADPRDAFIDVLFSS